MSNYACRRRIIAARPVDLKPLNSHSTPTLWERDFQEWWCDGAVPLEDIPYLIDLIDERLYYLRDEKDENGLWGELQKIKAWLEEAYDGGCYLIEELG